MQGWHVGAVNILRLIESEDTSMEARFMLPDATPENVLPIDWLRPHFVTEDGQLISAIFSLLIESCGKKIVVDTCVGNDKPRAVPQWNKKQSNFLHRMATLGFPRESVDYVVCTHLHPDHVGWNTMLVGDEWKPTFPNARYMFSKADWAWLEKAEVTPLGDYAGDSVKPVISAGLAEIYTPGYQLTDEVSLVSTPGHSPGHISVAIESCGEKAFITGDVMHHPAQIARPEWRSPFDFDGDAAESTRHDVLRQQAADKALVIGSHFATPSAGYIVPDEDQDDNKYRFDVDFGD